MKSLPACFRGAGHTQPLPIIPRALNLEHSLATLNIEVSDPSNSMVKSSLSLVRQFFVHPLTAEEVVVPGSKVDVETRRQELVPIPFVKYS